MWVPEFASVSDIEASQCIPFGFVRYKNKQPLFQACGYLPKDINIRAEQERDQITPISIIFLKPEII